MTAPSYASAASASAKTPAPAPSTGNTTAPVVSSTPAPASSVTPGNARTASVSPLNGSAGSNTPNNTANMSASSNAAANGGPSSASSSKPVTPAVPAVINGSTADHARNSSVTIVATAPNGYVSNGVAAGPQPKFGFESPAMGHSSPQPNTAAQRIPSPAHSPIPIPQPSASGGRPPSITQDGGNMKFGSFGGDGDRHLKHNFGHMPANLPAGNQSPHLRRGSSHSVHSDIGNPAGRDTHPHHAGNHGPHHGGPSARGGYSGRGGRGGFNNHNGGHNHFNGQSMPFQPQGQYRPPPNQGPRNTGAPPFQPRNVMNTGYGPGSPQAANSRASPAVPPILPSGTPQMQGAVPIPGGSPFMPMQYSTPTGFPPQPNNYPPYQQNYNMPYPTYQGMNPYGAPPPPQQGHGYHNSYGGQQYPPVAQPMSRNSSQAASERPTSSMGQVQTPNTAHAALAIPGSAQKATDFVKPKKKAIVIKNAQGETIDFNKKPAAAAPAVVSTPAVVARAPAIVSTPTPPPKSATPPTHSKSDSVDVRSAAEVQNEFKAKVAAASAATAATAAPVVVESKPKEEPKVEQKKSEPVIVSSTPAAAPAPAAEAKVEAPAPAKKEVSADPTEDEMEAMIREMEEEEAKREAEAAKYEAKRKAEKEAAAAAADANRAKNAAANDKLLREQEREMERLEEERERKRNEAEAAASGAAKPKSMTETLTEKISNIGSSNATDSLASKLGDLKITDKAGSETAAKRAKPSALNLAPLNTKTVEPPQPSAALQSLKTARFLRDPTAIAYPKGIQSPNPALNPAVNKKGNFKYDLGFLLQFKDVFVEKPSLDFDTQVKSLIGEEGSQRSGSRTPAGSASGRQGSRNASSAFNMGAMGSFNSKPLPPGTTSEQRFAMASGALPRPNNGGIASFGRPGSGFPGSSGMARTPSASIGGGIPNSPRQGSRSARGSSRQAPHNAKAEAQAAKTMPLTQGMDLKPIVISSTGWKPTSVGRAAAQTGATPGADIMGPEMVQRKVKSALNKMTPENFDKISEQILDIALQSKDEEDGRTLRQVIQLTFEKATDEAHWASMYARFCKRMLDQMSSEIRDVTIKDKKGDIISGGTLFRKYLLNRCQQEFERGWQIDLPEPKEGESKEAQLLSDEYYLAAAAKRRGLGLVQFIGELYKLGMLTERIMHECVRKLVDYEKMPDEGEIESLSKLLRTVGDSLDRTDKGRPMMDAYFERIKNIIDIPELPSRLRFMLMDVIDLRRRNWVSNEDNKGPKTLEEVRQDVAAQQAAKAAESARQNSQRGTGGRPGQRGDPRAFGYNQPAPNQVGMDDLRRLKGAASRVSSGINTLGPTSMFASRSNSGRRPGFARPGDDSGPASRTGTPPTRQDSNSVSHSNAFEALANVDTDTPASPPSTAASPAITKASIDKDAAN